MSSSPKPPTQVQTIPTRKMVLTDPSQLPSDYGTTPGGTVFSTTPGGTRIIYERRFLMQCRNSPLAKSPPANLPKIPGVTNTESVDTTKGSGDTCSDIPESTDEPQFNMDI